MPVRRTAAHWFVLVAWLACWPGCSARHQATDAAADRGPVADAPGPPDADGSLQPDVPSSEAGSDSLDGGLVVVSPPLTFRLVNRGARDVYLGLKRVDLCAFAHVVTGPPGTGGIEVTIDPPTCLCRACTCTSCPPPSCDELCGQDPPRIAPGGEYRHPWGGYTYQITEPCQGIRCANAEAAAGTYRIAIPLFDDADAARTTRAPVRTVEVSFTVAPGDAGAPEVEIAVDL